MILNEVILSDVLRVGLKRKKQWKYTAFFLLCSDIKYSENFLGLTWDNEFLKFIQWNHIKYSNEILFDWQERAEKWSR